ncbi:MAG: MFS transporter [Alphaproteobacteria bacterium]|nr:MFS transporter [Alphaproteobacteria bacterium]
MDAAKRNVLILAACQTLYMSGTSLMITTSPLIGAMMAPDKGLATLPLACHHAGVMAATIPASHLMRAIGRRNGFMLATLFGMTGATIAGLAVMDAAFWMFCLGVFIVGWFNGFAVFYRFAAADSASPEFRPKAISWVLTGGLFAAILGPELAKHTIHLLDPILYAGSYFSLIGLYVANLLLVSRVKIPPMTAEERAMRGRPLLQILKQPKCLMAVSSAIVAYGVMSLLMTSTPLAMQACGFAFNDSATVIQLHILGMFVPSFFTGSLVRRFGSIRIILVGILINIACVGVDLAGIHFLNFGIGLFLLGVGWNFMFIGATALLTETHDASERAKVQGFNDFAIFAVIASSAFSSGNLLHYFGWDMVNYGVLPLLAGILVFVLWQARADRRRVSAA